MEPQQNQPQVTGPPQTPPTPVQPNPPSTITQPLNTPPVAQPVGQVSMGAPNNGTAEGQEATKSYILAVVLSYFTGSLGLDRFYLGYVKLGILKLFLILSSVILMTATRKVVLLVIVILLVVYTDILLITFGVVKDKTGLALRGYAKYGKIVKPVVVLILIGSIFQLSTNFSILQDAEQQLNKTGSANGESSVTSGLSNTQKDDKRKEEIRSIYANIEGFGAGKDRYPTLDELNDSNFREKEFWPRGEDAYTDPDGTSSVIASKPAKGVYAYEVMPVGCNTTSVKCTSYVLTATLSNGETLIYKSLGL